MSWYACILEYAGFSLVLYVNSFLSSLANTFSSSHQFLEALIVLSSICISLCWRCLTEVGGVLTMLFQNAVFFCRAMELTVLRNKCPTFCRFCGQANEWITWTWWINNCCWPSHSQGMLLLTLWSLDVGSLRIECPCIKLLENITQPPPQPACFLCNRRKV
jgi:hypothetical protein